MASLLSLIKQASVEAVAEASPCAVLFGKLKSLTPLRVKVGERLTLEENQLEMTAAAALFAGVESDVLLLRVQGGAKFVIIDAIA